MMVKKEGKKVSVVGAGRVGVTLGYLLAHKKVPFAGIYSRSRTSAAKAMQLIQKGRIFPNLKDLLLSSHIILIAVNDEEIKKVVKNILDLRKCRGKFFIHTSGLLSSSVLSPLSSQGASIAAMHPLLTIPSAKLGIKSIKGSYFALEGDSEATTKAEELVNQLGGKSFYIAPHLKSRYHLAACFLSNYIVALSDLTMDLLPDKPMSKNEWLALFAPLMEATVRNLAREGLPEALTGPIARGDVSTLKKHIHLLKKLPIEVQKLHQILARRALQIAQQKKELGKEKSKELLELLNAAIR